MVLALAVSAVSELTVLLERPCAVPIFCLDRTCFSGTGVTPGLYNMNGFVRNRSEARQVSGAYGLRIGQYPCPQSEHREQHDRTSHPSLSEPFLTRPNRKPRSCGPGRAYQLKQSENRRKALNSLN